MSVQKFRAKCWNSFMKRCSYRIIDNNVYNNFLHSNDYTSWHFTCFFVHMYKYTDS